MDDNFDPKKALYGFLIAFSMPIILFFSVQTIDSCSQKKKNQIYVYNALDYLMRVEINGWKRTLAGGAKLEITMKPGEYKVKSIVDSKTIVDTTIVVTDSLIKNGGLLNLSGESFFLYTQEYAYRIPGLESSHDLYDFNHKSEGLDTVILVDDRLIFGEVREITKDNIFVPRTWDVGIDEVLKTKIETQNSSVGSTVKLTKIFDKKRMLSYRDWDRLQDLDD